MLTSLPKSGSSVGSIPGGCKENKSTPYSASYSMESETINKRVHIFQSCPRFLESQNIGKHLYPCSSPKAKIILTYDS